MLRNLALLAISAIFVVSIAACGKQEAEPEPGTAMQMEEDVAIPQKGQEAIVDVPAEVKSAWSGIKVMVNNKAKNSSTEYTIDLGGEMKIPGTDLTIQAMEFLPSFVMQGLNITSASNEPNNPAAKVVITEGGAEVFKGWLFQKFPETHAFTHPEYSITLLEGVPAS